MLGWLTASTGAGLAAASGRILGPEPQHSDVVADVLDGYDLMCSRLQQVAQLVTDEINQMGIGIEVKCHHIDRPSQEPKWSIAPGSSVNAGLLHTNLPAFAVVNGKRSVVFDPRPDTPAFPEGFTLHVRIDTHNRWVLVENYVYGFPDIPEGRWQYRLPDSKYQIIRKS